MLPKRLQFGDLRKKVDFLLMTHTPKNIKQIPDDIQSAYILYKDDLYFFDREAAEKFVYIRMDSKKLVELKHGLGLIDIKLNKDEFRKHIDGMSDEQLAKVVNESNHYPTWMHKVLFTNQRAAELLQQIWESESRLIAIEERIAALEALCVKKFTAADLENIYPKAYKKSQSRPTDFRNIKLEELRQRIDLLGAADNKKALAEKAAELKDIVSQYTIEKALYLQTTDIYQALDTELSDYSKNFLTADLNRQKVRGEVHRLPLEARLALVSVMPGASSLGALIDIMSQLKQIYEQELTKAFSVATGKKFKWNNFEEMFLELFKKPAKEHFKEFAKKPASEMQNVKAEIDNVITQFWQKLGFNIANENKRNECNVYLQTVIYLSCTLETYRFTDKVQRLNITAAVGGKIGSLFGGEDIAGEFLDKLSMLQVQNSFAITPSSALCVTPLENTLELWLEAAIWLYGLHYRTFTQIAPALRVEGEVKPEALNHLGDNDDRKFFEHKPPLVKWSLAQFHERHYQILLLLLPRELVEALIPFLPANFVREFKDKHHIVDHVAEVVAFPSQQGPVLSSQPVDSPEKIPDKEVKASVLPSSVAPSLGSGLCLFGASASKEKAIPIPVLKPVLKFADLDRIKGKQTAEKLPFFYTLLLKCEFNDDENACIEAIKLQIIGILKAYMGAWFTSTWHVPTVLFAQKHLSEVTEAHKKITESTTPREYLIDLYTVWASVYGDKSTMIGPDAEKLLEIAFNNLHTLLEPKRENTVANTM